MGNNQYYWKEKNNRSIKAQNHAIKMDNNYPDEIKECIKNTKSYYDFDLVQKRPINKPNIYVESTDSVSAVFMYGGDDKTAVLNFASYKNPGGGFLAGSRAQEECLCHESFLYNVLKEKTSYYEWNKKHLNRAMYTNRALYSPDVIFERHNDYGDFSYKVNCDVITCASPNYAAGSRQMVTYEENVRILEERIKFVLDVAEDNGVDTLILGAFGCGVFEQDSKIVAKLFHQMINNYGFKTVVFAVINAKNDNYMNFENEFRKL